MSVSVLRLTPVVVLVVVMASAACGPSPAALERTASEFALAVQDRDYDRLFCLAAGASESPELGSTPEQRRRVFEEWAAEQIERYESGRDEGRVELSGHGLTLVKLFALGRGTFANYELPRRTSDGGVRLAANLRFGYQAVDLSTFSPGTTFYLTGVPVGTVHGVKVPRGYREVTLEVLDTLRIEWTLVASEGNDVCPAGWTVASVVPTPESEITTRLTWEF